MTSAREMHAAVMARAVAPPTSSSAAAVADYRVANAAGHKLKKDTGGVRRPSNWWKIPTSWPKWRPLAKPPFCVGFAGRKARIFEEYAQKKRPEERFRSSPAISSREGFGGEDNRLVLFDDAGSTPTPVPKGRAGPSIGRTYRQTYRKKLMHRIDVKLPRPPLAGTPPHATWPAGLDLRACLEGPVHLPRRHHPGPHRDGYPPRRPRLWRHDPAPFGARPQTRHRPRQPGRADRFRLTRGGTDGGRSGTAAGRASPSTPDHIAQPVVVPVLRVGFNVVDEVRRQPARRGRLRQHRAFMKPWGLGLLAAGVAGAADDPDYVRWRGNRRGSVLSLSRGHRRQFQPALPQDRRPAPGVPAQAVAQLKRAASAKGPTCARSWPTSMNLISGPGRSYSRQPPTRGNCPIPKCGRRGGDFPQRQPRHRLEALQGSATAMTPAAPTRTPCLAGQHALYIENPAQPVRKNVKRTNDKDARRRQAPVHRRNARCRRILRVYDGAHGAAAVPLAPGKVGPATDRDATTRVNFGPLATPWSRLLLGGFFACTLPAAAADGIPDLKRAEAIVSPAACHGPNGEAASAVFPDWPGSMPNTSANSLPEFKNGRRRSDIMKPRPRA